MTSSIATYLSILNKRKKRNHFGSHHLPVKYKNINFKSTSSSMSDVSVITFTNLSGAIQRIQTNIDHINAVTEQAIQILEEKKTDLRNTTDPNLKKVEADIDNINLEHDRLVDKLIRQKTDVSLRKQSIDRLDQAIAELDMEISRIQSERNEKIEELERKKSYIIQRLNSVQDLQVTVRNISTQIYESTHDFNLDMAEMAMRRLEIENDPNLTESKRALALAEIDREIEERKEAHDEYLNSLKRQRDESLLKVRDIDMDTGTAYQIQLTIQDEIDKLEVAKIGATPSQLEEINRKLRVLKKQKEEVAFLRDLNERGLRMSPSGHIITGSGRIFTVAEAEKAGLLQGLDISQWLAQEQLRDEGLEVTASGNIRTTSGRVVSVSQAQREGLLRGVNVQALLQQVQQVQQEEVSSAPTVSNLSEETYAGLASEDVEYLKEALGKPLTLALAEVCAKQPRDPIHYLGHWLFKYRYNQEIDEVRKKEVEQLTAERERIRKEAWQIEVETAAKEAVLEMIFRAHDMVLQKELDAIARLQEMEEAENEELEDEARDILGDLGLPIGQKS